MTTAIQDKIGASNLQMRGRSVPVETAEDDIIGGFWLRLSGRWQKAKSMDNLWDISDLRTCRCAVYARYLR